MSLRQLLFSHPTAQIQDISNDGMIKIGTDMPQEEVAQRMKR
ncbi:hypothetical protein [Microcoleus sp. FACHB-68]|nr:hypothetical protein [Microcoleus sp. FACHB-68]